MKKPESYIDIPFPYEFKCSYCGGMYKTRRPESKYCSGRCRTRAYLDRKKSNVNTRQETSIPVKKEVPKIDR